MSKRDRDRILAACLILTSAALVLALTIAVMRFTYSDRANRDAERYQAAAAEPQKSDQQDVCLTLTIPQEIANCIRLKDAATLEQKQAQSDLHAQHDMAAFAHGLLWFSALSFVTGAGGFVALVWTFSETRKMTRSQEIAYVEFIDLRFFTHGTYGARVFVRIANCGRTPAKDITFTGKLLVYENPSVPGTYEVNAALSVLPGGTERDIVGRMYDFTSHFSNLLADYSDGGSHHKHTFTLIEDPDGPSDPKVEISGKIVWHDIYDAPNSIDVWDWAQLHSGGSPVWINNTNRRQQRD